MPDKIRMGAAYQGPAPRHNPETEIPATPTASKRHSERGIYPASPPLLDLRLRLLRERSPLAMMA